MRKQKLRRHKGALASVEQEIMIMRSLRTSTQYSMTHALDTGTTRRGTDDPGHNILQLLDAIRTPSTIYIVVCSAFQGVGICNACTEAQKL